MIINGRNNNRIQYNEEDARTPDNNAYSTRILGSITGPSHDHAIRIALISDYETARCAGAIQNALYIITAAHCVSGIDHLQLIVTAGTGPVFPKFPRQNRSVVSIDIHPDWDSKTLLNDVAILKLNHSLFIAGGQVSPRELGPPIPPGGNVTDVWIVGWGLYKGGWDRNKNRTYPKFRQSTPVTLVDANACKDFHQKQGKQKYTNQICARAEVGTGPCTGDDGAPLSIGVLYPNLVWRIFVIGILSSFQDCATGAIDNYTELGHYITWIESIAGRQCDFNIYAYNEDTRKKFPNKRQSSKPKGRIDEEVANAICASYYAFTETSKIQGLLKSATKLTNYKSSTQSVEKASVCTNVEWNDCSTCNRFERVKCKEEPSASTLSQIPTRIIGGNDAVPNQNPHQIRISRVIDDTETPTACGGFIYNSMYVLTAAYCVSEDMPCVLLVTAGDHSVSIKEETEQIRRVVSIIIHEHYNHDDAYKNNIALLRLDRPFIITKYVHPVLLASQEYPTNEVLIVELSGWGFLNSKRVQTDVLQSVEVPFVDDCNCRLAYASMRGSPINFDKICAGLRGHGICNGDTGTPWTVKDKDTRYVVGLTSFTGSCTVGPGVATKILAYREWIYMRAG